MALGGRRRGESVENECCSRVFLFGFARFLGRPRTLAIPNLVRPMPLGRVAVIGSPLSPYLGLPQLDIHRRGVKLR
jgi:hypothetical protein